MARKRLKRCSCTHEWGHDCFRYDHEDTFYKLQMLDAQPQCPKCNYYPWEIVVRGGKHDKNQD
jgi:hypothetical protein